MLLLGINTDYLKKNVDKNDNFNCVFLLFAEHISADVMRTLIKSKTSVI